MNTVSDHGRALDERSRGYGKVPDKVEGGDAPARPSILVDSARRPKSHMAG